MVEHYIRHENMLTVTMILTDPIYWEEPFIRSATFELDANTRVLPEPCEPQVEIPRSPGEVPHYLPGANPYLTEFPKLYNLPMEAARGGANDDLSGVRQGAAHHLQGARQVHGVLLRRHHAGGDEQLAGGVPDGRPAASRPAPRWHAAPAARRSAAAVGLAQARRGPEP